MGNICRSPAAEGVMRAMLQKAGLGKMMTVDSAGTLDYHTGKQPDKRMVDAAAKRGVILDHQARQVRANDLVNFDLILAMDKDNLAEIKTLDPEARYRSKIKLFGEFCTRYKITEVPDPYLGGSADFELVLDLLEDGCAEIVCRIQAGTMLPP
ncbi:MAG: low molecular weight phosphotyrosine protein phosphatase [Verrucomicrobia bacterium]|nr:low molecular weight phosphotyrosine protein phosphatase [Verrucomicrobiota bacterium]